MRESVAIRAMAGEREVQIGGVSWAYGTRLVPVRDVLMPERVDAWGSFPGNSDQPVIRMQLEVRQGIPSFTRIEVEAATSGVDLSAAHIGQVRDNLEWWRDVIVKHTAQEAASRREVDSEGRDVLLEPAWADSDKASDAGKQARRGAPRKATDARHERVAMIYKAHASGKPLEAIRDAFRGPSGGQISVRTAARYAKEAEDAGYLPPTTKGKKRI